MTKTARPPAIREDDPRHFKIMTAASKAYMVKGEDGAADQYFIEGTASSSVEDRYGDILSETCQTRMLEQARGLTMWLNHSYSVPEDILGTCVDATLQRNDAPEGSCLDLVIKVQVDSENPRAMKAWQHIQAGTKLGFSIGGYFLDADWIDPDDWWSGLIVNDIELLEISLVGIPANPRAYTKFLESATAGLRAEVVKRAEQIAVEAKNDALAARTLMKKSLGLEQRARTAPADGVVKTGEPAIADGKEREVLLDAEVVNDELAGLGLDAELEPTAVLDTPQPSTKAVEDEMAQGAIVECMRSVAKMAAHGLCVESMTLANTTHAVLKSLLPENYELPDDAQLAAAEFTLKVAVEGDLKALEIGLDALKSETEEVLATRNSAQAELNQLSADKVARESEIAELDQKIAQLKATPTGRSTQSSFSGGSSKGNEPTAPAELYYQSSTELAASAMRDTRSTVGGPTGERPS